MTTTVIGNRRLSAAIWLQAIPIERVLPRLGRVVEDGGFFRLSCGIGDDLLQRQAGIFCFCRQLVQIVHIAFVRFPVMETERFG